MIVRRLFGATGHKVIKKGIWTEHPISCMTLGICSALAISNKVENAIAMSVGVMFVLILTAVLISILRKVIPSRVRIIVYMITISSGVIIVDRVLKAYFPGISQALGPYVGLIITNCIIMGRAEAFYAQNGTYHSLLDAVSNGFAYAYTLISIAIFREALGFGTVLGFRIMPDWWVNWSIMVAPAGAFFFLGVFLWITRTLANIEPPGKG